MRAAIVITALALVGCHTTPNQPNWKAEQALLALCSEKPVLKGGTGKEILLWGTALSKSYEECAARHKRLVEAIPKEE